MFQKKQIKLIRFPLWFEFSIKLISLKGESSNQKIWIGIRKKIKRRIKLTWKIELKPNWALEIIFAWAQIIRLK